MSTSVDVLGISGSPLSNSNTDQALRHMLAATGLKTEFVKFSELTWSLAAPVSAA